MKYLISTFLLGVLASMQMYAQGPVDAELYQLLGFSSQSAFRQAISNNQTIQVSTATIAGIADAYRKSGDSENAELWYEYLANYTNKPLHRIHYAQMLQSNGRFDEAEKNFLTYLQLVRSEEKGTQALGDFYDRAEYLRVAAQRARDYRNEDEVILENVAVVNSEFLDFSPSYYRGGIVFTSTRPLDSKNRSGGELYSLLYAERDRLGRLKRPVPFSTNLTSVNLNEGPVTFSKDGSIIFFTQNSRERRGLLGRAGKTVMKIYQATRSGNEWINVTELPFNSDEYSCIHPTLSADGTQLFFASDRPGGYGGMDLYVSELINGVWTQPRNLGSAVNTSGNEVFPFIHDDGTLYFASDGHPGKGGFDIFFTTSREEYGNTVWGNVTNMGTPFNSAGDDLGFILNVTGTEGYFASNRVGGSGQDDIYGYFNPKGINQELRSPVSITARICVNEKDTEIPVAGAEVYITERQIQVIKPRGANERYIARFTPAGNDRHVLSLAREEEEDRNFRFVTDHTGQFTFVMRNDKRYTFEIIQDGYKRTEQRFLTEGFATSQDLDFCIPVEKEICMPIIGAVVNKRFNRALPGATVTVLNKCTGEVITATSDADGAFNFCLDCGCEYEIRGEKLNFLGDADNISTITIDCEKAMHFTLELTPNIEINEGEDVEYEEGLTIELRRIFYDYDSYNIRQDARAPLNQLARVMQAYPSMKIELSAHTDSRGTPEYNMALSSRRAEAATNFLVSRGVNRNRIVFRGYGETRLLNHCREGVECSEAEHQLNRRTEFRITEFDRSDYLRIDYIENEPETVSGRTE